MASQIVVLLDDNGAVLSVNKTLAGTDFAAITSDGAQLVHTQLHGDCTGECRFDQLWGKAWEALSNRESIEWEVDDDRLQRVFRLNLSLVPTVRPVVEDRRQKSRVLTITDITKYRREYEELVEREQALEKLMAEHGIIVGDGNPWINDDSADIESSGARRSLAGQIIEAQEAERRRVASDLHDGIAQSLGVVKFMLEDNIAAVLSRHKDLDVTIFEPVIEQIRVALDEVRRISANLSPSMLDDFGLCVALDWLCTQFQADAENVTIKCASCVAEGDLPDLVKVTIYRVVQESLNNAVKHAQAGNIVITLTSETSGTKLTIEDDGSGFSDTLRSSPAADRTGLGLRSMRERVEATGGVFEIESQPGEGTRISSSWSGDKLSLLSNKSVLEGVDGHS